MAFPPKNKIFIIAEMANSHEGNLSVAKEITKHAVKSGADAIKFQKFTAQELVESTHENYDFFKKLEMSIREWEELISFAKTNDLKVFVDIFGVRSARQISKFDIDGFKIHSSDIGSAPLLRALGNTKKPILLSTAGCNLNEINEALKMLLKKQKEIVLMHGFQGYPTKIYDINLLRILKLKEKYDFPIGIMDHISGNSEMALIIPLLAIMLGVKIVEKHLTLDRSKKGSDYYSALNPDEFKKLVNYIRLTEKTLGSDNFILSKNEIAYRLSHKKNPITRQYIRKGSELRENMFEFKRTFKKNHLSILDFKGNVASKNISKNTPLTRDLISKKTKKVAAILACRVHSSRLFAKQLQLVGNYSILQLTLNQLKKSKLIDEIVLGISERPGNEVFINFAKEHQLKFIIGDDRDVLKRLTDGAKYVNADIVFRITPENPYIYWEGIDPLIKKHISGNFDFSILIDAPLGSGFEVINREALERSHKNGSKRHRSELCSLYIYEHQNKFKIHRFQTPKKIQRSELRLTVDTPQDLFVARQIYKSVGKNGKPVPLQRIIKFLDNHPDIAKINSNIPLGVSRIW